MKKWGVLIALIGLLAGPAFAQHQLTQYTTLFSGTGTGDGTVRLDVQSFSSVLLKVRIASTGTVNFKGSADGLDTTNLATCSLVSDTAGTQVASTTSSGDYFCSTANLKEVFINVSANGSGVTVNAIGSTASAKRGGGGGGGSGTVTSVDASGGVETASGSAITGTGTIRGALCVNAQTGTSYTVLATDRGCVVTFTNADPVSVTLPEAGTTGFESGFYFQPVNLGAGTVTITPTTSTIQAAEELDLTTGKSTTIASDGTNYVHAPGLGLTAEAQGLSDVILINRTFGGAVSAATGPRFGSDATGRYLILFDDPTTGLALECETTGGIGHCDKGHTVQDTFKSFIADAAGARLTNFEPNAATSYEQWALGTKKILAAWDVPMYAHAGAATMALAQPVTGEAKKFWGTLTDSASDMFSFSFTATKAMEGATTATVRLVGVSTNASPANDVQLECSIVSARPGTDTTVSHSTSNKQTVTLTPAVQNRRVSAVSSAITINGTVAMNAIIDGVCNVNAGGTTSTQLANFFLLGSAHIQWLKSSMSN